MTCGDNVSPGVWCPEMPQIQNDSDCQYVDYDGYTCSFETLLSEPLCAVMDDMTYQKRSRP